MDVVFVVTTLNVGGAETQVVSIAKHLHSKGLTVGIVTLIKSSDFDAELISANIPVKSLNMKRGVPNPFTFLSLYEVLNKWKPDIIHSHMFHANVMTRLIKLFLRSPKYISTIHSIDEGGTFRETAYRLTDKLCDLTTNVCKAGLERYKHLKAVSDRKARTVANGIDTGFFCQDKHVRSAKRNELEIDDKFVWLAVGSLLKEKDYANMLQAFSIFSKTNSNSILLIAGRGPLEHDLKSLARSLNVENCIRFLGLRRDVSGLMNAADAYVMSSCCEGLAMVLLEACSSGLPVVATDVGGNKEIVIDGYNGFIVPPHDPNALSEGMRKIMNLQLSERVSMGTFGREFVVQNFNIDFIVRQWIAIYTELLQGTKTG